MNHEQEQEHNAAISFLEIITKVELFKEH